MTAVKRFAGVPTIGMIGGGQLARMTHQAAIGLGVRFRLLAEGAGMSAGQVINDVTVGDYTDLTALRSFAEGCDAITFDHEHVPGELLRALEAQGVACRPGSDALRYAQDKVAMRERLSALGVPCPRHRVVQDRADVAAFAAEKGAWPVVLKTARGGYDGKGVWLVDGPEDATVDEPFRAGVAVLAEKRVPFARELAAVVARSPSGQTVAYPVVESVQREGICHEIVAPAPALSGDRATEAQQIALRIAGELGVVGILAVELFETNAGELLVNELAMRPHNSGHWSIDGAVTSQFENHVRAVLDLPLGDPSARAPWTVMVNVLGGELPNLHHGLLHCLARDPRLRVHLYGKQVKPRRKVGHVTTYGADLDQLRDDARHAAAYLTGEIDE